MALIGFTSPCYRPTGRIQPKKVIFRHGPCGDAGTGGDGGTAGAGGNAGTGGSVNDPDGGVDPDAGDAAPPPPPVTTRQEAAEGICGHFDDIPACTNPGTCVDDQFDGMDFFTSLEPECPELVDAYFFCQADSPQSAYECTDGAPATSAGTCQTEFDAMAADFNSVECCPDQNCGG